MGRQHKTHGGKRHHQNWDQRQKRKVGNCRAKLAAQTIVKAFRRTNEVCHAVIGFDAVNHFVEARNLRIHRVITGFDRD